MSSSGSEIVGSCSVHPKSNLGPVFSRHLFSVLESHHESEVHDPTRVGELTYGVFTDIALDWLVADLVAEAEGGLPRVLVGNNGVTARYKDWGNDEPYTGFGATEGETWRTRELRILIRHAATRDCSEDLHLDSIESYTDYTHEHCDRVLLPYCVHNQHFVVFDVVTKGPGGPLLKVWDPLDSFSSVPAEEQLSIPEVVCTTQTFFHEGTECDVVIHRAEGDPNQGETHGCAAFAFFAVAFLARNKRPPPATAAGDAFLRNYLAGCVIQGRVLPLPRRRFVE